MYILYVWNWVTLLHSRDWQNIANQLYVNFYMFLIYKNNVGISKYLPSHHKSHQLKPKMLRELAKRYFWSALLFVTCSFC